MRAEIALVNENSIRDKIYVIRGKEVMIDSDLAEIYGYETKNFNRQVKNNIDKFDEDFMFRLTDEEIEQLSRCKNFTTMQREGIKGGRVYNPYAFTEQGIYMLMTVLKGELATKQSKALIRIFKNMKDYIVKNDSLEKYDNIIKLSLQTNENTNDIKMIKKDIASINKKLLENNYSKEILILNGNKVESNLAYNKIYKMAKKSIYIIDDYINLKTLVLLKDINKNVKVTIFSDNVNNKLHKIEYDDFMKEYPSVNISFKVTNNMYHDRYIILDYNSKTEHIFHCGSSSKDSGSRVPQLVRLMIEKYIMT